MSRLKFPTTKSRLAAIPRTSQMERLAWVIVTGSTRPGRCGTGKTGRLGLIKTGPGTLISGTTNLLAIPVITPAIRPDKKGDKRSRIPRLNPACSANANRQPSQENARCGSVCST